MTVSLPRRGITGTTRVTLAEAPFLAVSIDRSGSVVLRSSSDEFGYL